MNDKTRSNPVEEHIKSRSAWMRLLYMLLFAAILSLVGTVLSATAIIQFVIYLLSGQPNPNLRQFGQGVATYTYQIIQFLCFNSEEHPFPFAPWPDAPPQGRAETGERDSSDERSGV